MVVLLPHVFDSAGFAGAVFGLTQVVVEAFLYFHYFVVLCSRSSLPDDRGGGLLHRALPAV
ncbi:hypothetical protein Taro_006053 [Colocasia esculenta]|uniref:Uncharacterized protein n=1 Tax=Colocasia esculenta TaxID=4460 RepID=A0A843TRJ5_COLES|nr:hypothetical protein [Colocasia esculenta]